MEVHEPLEAEAYETEWAVGGHNVTKRDRWSAMLQRIPSYQLRLQYSLCRTSQRVNRDARGSNEASHSNLVKRYPDQDVQLERTTGFEPATLTLAT